MGVAELLLSGVVKIGMQLELKRKMITKIERKNRFLFSLFSIGFPRNKSIDLDFLVFEKFHFVDLQDCLIHH